MIALYQVFLNEPIVVKGALNYSLKSITRALFENNLISTIWDTSSSCANGLNAMLLAYKIYNKQDSNPDEDFTMKEIKKYNEIDCKCLWEIINYLRKNH
jgi:predicted RecB family nuclease